MRLICVIRVVQSPDNGASSEEVRSCCRFCQERRYNRHVDVWDVEVTAMRRSRECVPLDFRNA